MELFQQLALLVVLATVLGIILDKLRQPALLGYLMAGWMGAKLGLIHYEASDVLSTFSEVGVTLLLFLVGMELSWPRLQSVGKTAVSTGIGQIVFTTAGGLLLALTMGYPLVTALYVAVALTFSSTIIVVKLFGEKKDLQSLHGRIAMGMLLVQDAVAILILVMLGGISEGSMGYMEVIGILVKFVILAGGVIGMSRYVVPRLVEWVAHSTELLFLLSVCWGLGWAALLSWESVGFSIEVGGFVAGVMLANAIEQHQIVSRLRPLRDFFIMLFFVYIGAGLSFGDIAYNWPAVVVFSVFVLIGNPVIVMVIMKWLRYRARTSFMTSLAVAQVSEFSLILVALGQKLGHLEESVVGMTTLVAAVTMAGSTYLILGADKLWKRHGHLFKWWQVKEEFGGLENTDWNNHIILIGCDRAGREILKELRVLNQAVVVMDMNPEIVKSLRTEGVEVMYSDLEDVDNLETVRVDKARMIISTVTDKEATLLLLEYLQQHKHRRDLYVVVSADYGDEVVLFEDKGADYVSVPMSTTGKYVAGVVRRRLGS